jgi:hypothetical protein
MQIDRGRAMTEVVPAQRAISAPLVIQACPAGRRLSLGGVIHTVQFDPVTELVIIVESNPVLDGHACLRQTVEVLCGNNRYCGDGLRGCENIERRSESASPGVRGKARYAKKGSLVS